MKKKVTKKLSLSKETLVTLESGKLIEAVGGGGNSFQIYTCPTNYTCPDTR